MEFAWDKNSLTNVSPVCGPSERISALEVGVAIGKMKQGKSAGPTGVMAEMLKAAGETGTLWMTDMCNAVVKDGKVPDDWSKSWMVIDYKAVAYLGGPLGHGPPLAKKSFFSP